MEFIGRDGLLVRVYLDEQVGQWRVTYFRKMDHINGWTSITSFTI